MRSSCFFISTWTSLRKTSRMILCSLLEISGVLGTLTWTFRTLLLLSASFVLHIVIASCFSATKSFSIGFTKVDVRPFIERIELIFYWFWDGISITFLFFVQVQTSFAGFLSPYFFRITKNDLTSFHYINWKFWMLDWTYSISMCQKLCNGCFSSRLTQFFAEYLCSWELLEMLRYDWKIYLKLDCLKELYYSFFKCEYLKWKLDAFNEDNTHWLQIDGVYPWFWRKENFCRFFIPIRLTLLLCWEFAFI